MHTALAFREPLRFNDIMNSNSASAASACTSTRVSKEPSLATRDSHPLEALRSFSSQPSRMNSCLNSEALLEFLLEFRWLRAISDTVLRMVKDIDACMMKDKHAWRPTDSSI